MSDTAASKLAKLSAWQEGQSDKVTIPRPQYEAYRAAKEAWDLVDKLRAPEGHAITLICDNPDFNGQPNCAIEVCGDWTDWQAKRFTGDTVMEALRKAAAVLSAWNAMGITRVSPRERMNAALRAAGIETGEGRD